MKLKMNDCLLLILSFLTGWYVCNRYHDRDRLVEGLSDNERMWAAIVIGIVVLIYVGPTIIEAIFGWD